MSLEIGFIQGRLSPLVGGMIQAFPWEHWREEFPLAHRLGFSTMEWTLDADRLWENPWMTTEGRKEILSLMEKFRIQIPSLTGDFFMQAPFFKETGDSRERLLGDLDGVIQACGRIGTRFLVIPLVDNGSVQSSAERETLQAGLSELEPTLRHQRVKIVFESDLAPQEYAVFMKDFPEEFYGVNYDSGNSASLGFNCSEEFQAYGERVLNIHIKDRVLGGTTVPLGEGDADFAGLFDCIRSSRYAGNLILQTARAEDGNHSGVLGEYKKQVERWISN